LYNIIYIIMRHNTTWRELSSKHGTKTRLLKPATAIRLNEYDATAVDNRQENKKVLFAGPPKTVITENIFFLPSCSSCSLYLLTFLFKLFLLKFDIFALLVCRYTMSLFFFLFFLSRRIFFQDLQLLNKWPFTQKFLKH